MLLDLLTLTQISKQPTPPPPPPEPIPIVQVIEQEEPKLYTIKQGDSLSKVAKKNKTTVKRLWSFNRQLKHQDKLEPGDKVKIPSQDAKLKPRAFIKAALVNMATKATKRSVGFVRGFGGANSYTPGQCTHLAKSKRPDIPNTWGDAINWLGAARSQGWPTGSTPRVGAIAWESLGHVSIVIAVRGNMVTVIEQNWKGPFIVSTRTAPASRFSFIY